MKLNEVKKLLEEFEDIPKELILPTYLEICKYPYHRFEEICSRILKFYFIPSNEHGFNGLFINTLLEILINKKIADKTWKYHFSKLKVNTEVFHENKRIDLTIEGDNFVIGIENKISAGLNNPLETYKRKLQEYNKEHTIGIILSINKIQNRLIDGFYYINYFEFFNKIRQELGYYLKNCNDRYLAYLNDFMTTIENMDQKKYLNTELDNYFFNNSEKVDELLRKYSEFNSKVQSFQFQKLLTLKEKLEEKTNHKWWIWNEFWLGFDMFNHSHKIGVECYYETINNNPLGKFKIQITTWNKDDWKYYQEKINDNFSDLSIKEENNRVWLEFKTLNNSDDGDILCELISLFNKIKELK